MFDYGLLKTLCAMRGVSGDESRVREFIKDKLTAVADEIKTDKMGNLMVFRKGAAADGKKLMLCAHMDEVGMIVRSITDDGYLRFGCVGGIDRRVLIGRKVAVGENAVPGIIGIKAVHLLEKNEHENAPKPESMYIDIGTANKEAASKLVELGDYVSFDGEIYEYGENMIKAKALDDRFGCAVLTQVCLESKPYHDTWFVFTSQEETGLRGSATAAYTIAPDIGVTVEATTAADVYDVPDRKKICCVGKGAVIPVLDGGAIADPKLFECLTGLADSEGIPWQTKEMVAGGTDAARIQKTGAGAMCATVSLPARYIHSATSAAGKDDMNSVYRLVLAFTEKGMKENA